MASNPSSDSVAASSGGSSSASESMGFKIMLNDVVGDWIWVHGISLDRDDTKIQCRYCDEIITGGVYLFKHHLAGTEDGVEACYSVSDEVREEILENLAGLQEKSVKKSSEEGCVGVGGKIKGKEVVVGSSGNIFKRRRTSSQANINDKFKKNLKEEADQAIARFFYNNGIPLNLVMSDEFIAMCDLISRHGLGFKPPSYDEIRAKYLKENVKLTREALEEHRAVWKITGCTIIADGWTDKRRRTILNFLVNSPKGTVFLKSIDVSHISNTADKLFKIMDDIVEEVGEENVVQVVTDNAENYKAAGEMLMEKRTRLFWTPCVAHCIEMMLENFGKKIPIHEETIPKGKRITSYIYSRTSLISMLQHFTKGKDLVKPGITRFATSYLTLGCLHEQKRALIRMFNSKEWKSSQFAKTRDGKFVEDVVLDKEFWKNIIICLKGANPLIKVLRLVDLDDKPAMGFIYEAMDQAKEKIQNLFNGVKKSYMPLWEIIDERWDKQLHRPLHAAGYFLNPQLHYSPGFRADNEVKRGLYGCITRMVADPEEQAKISIQLDDFDKQAKFLGHPLARMTADKKVPSAWWDSYGFDHPELQKFAIRVLSLTCSSFGYEPDRSSFKMVHTKRRNRLRQKTVNDVVFVMANSKLAKKKQARGGSFELNLDDISSDDEWITENDNGDIESLDVGNLDLVTPYPNKD